MHVFSNMNVVCFAASYVFCAASAALFYFRKEGYYGKTSYD